MLAHVGDLIRIGLGPEGLHHGVIVDGRLLRGRPGERGRRAILTLVELVGQLEGAACYPRVEIKHEHRDRNENGRRG